MVTGKRCHASRSGKQGQSHPGPTPMLGLYGRLLDQALNLGVFVEIYWHILLRSLGCHRLLLLALGPRIAY